MCPYFERELKKGGEPLGIRCKAATVNFPSKEARRKFIYPLCGSIDGFSDCPMFQYMQKEAPAEKQEPLQSEAPKETKRQRKKLSAAERWQSMSLKELSVVLSRMHKSYGEVQSMYYNGTLPDDFGI